MPYESPNIVIVPTVGFQTSKKKPLAQCNKDNVGTSTLPSINECLKTKVTTMPQEAEGKHTSEAAVASNLNPKITSQDVQGITQTVVNPVQPANASNAHSDKPKYQSDITGDSTSTEKPSILCTSNDIIEDNVVSTDEKKIEPLIKINLLSRSKVTKTGETPAGPTPLQTENKNTEPTIDMAWTAPLVPHANPASYSWTTPIQYQTTYPTQSTGYCPSMETTLSPQYPTNTLYTQNQNFSSHNVNYETQNVTEYSYIHYYTPSYKSPMDSAWLNDQYYAQLINDNSYKYFNPTTTNQCENNHTALPVPASDAQNSHSDKKTSWLDEPVMNTKLKSNTTTKIGKEMDKPKTFENKKPINPDSFNLGTDCVEESTRSESKINKKQPVDKKSKIISTTSRSKHEKSSKSEVQKNQKEKIDILRKQIQKLENIIAEKRNRSQEQTLNSKRSRDRHDEEPLSKKRRLTNINLRQDNKRDGESRSKIRSKYSKEGFNPEHRKERIRRNSDTEQQPKKRVRRNSENIDHAVNRSDIIKSKKSHLRHPRLPEDQDSDDDLQSDFDLRSKLSRRNSDRYKRNNGFCDKTNKKSPNFEHENLLITVNRNEDDVTQPKPSPPKIKQKSRKYKKIKLVINVICNSQESSENSSSDENVSIETEKDSTKSTNSSIESASNLRSDFSFLDDINIDEIVDSLKQQEHTVKNVIEDNVQQHVKQAVETATMSVDFNKRFVQPIVIKREMKTEPEDPDENFECSNQNLSESVSDNTIIVRSLNNSITEEENNCLKAIQNIKQEKYGEPDDINEEVQYAECEDQRAPEDQAIALNDNNSTIKHTTRDTEQTCTDNNRSIAAINNIKNECSENYDSVNTEADAAVDNHNFSENLHEKLTPELIDEDTQELETYSACEPMDIDQTYSFSFPDFRKTVTEENNNYLNDETENPESINECTLTVTEIVKASTEERTIENMYSSDQAINSPKPIVENTTFDNRNNGAAPTIVMDPLEISHVESKDHEHNVGLSIPVENIVKSEEARCEIEKVNNNKDTNIEIISEPIIKVQTPQITNVLSIMVHSLEIVSSNDKAYSTTEATNTNQEQIEGTVNISTSSQTQKSVNSSIRTAEKELPPNTLVKNNAVEEESKKPPQNKTIVKNINTSTKLSKTSPTVKKKITQKAQGKIPVKKDKPHNAAKSGETVAQKDKATEDKNLKNTETPRTVQIKPSLKSDKVLALKIEERILSYLKLKLSIISLIHYGKFSKIFHCQGNGQQYALKFILDEKHRTTHGINKETMLSNLQKDIPKQNLNTVFLINGFGLGQNWCFLMEYYPKNLKEVLSDTVFDMDSVQMLTRQLVSAVMVMRNNGIVHSDIKPSHILLDGSNKRLKVCGFDEAYYLEELVKVLPNMGSAGYRPPEVILGYSADFAVDVWTTAQVMYEMVAGHRPFRGQLFNNNTLYQQMSLLGYLPADIIQQSRFGRINFVGNVFKRIMGPGRGQCLLYNADSFGPKQKIYPFLKPIAGKRWPRLKKQDYHKQLAKLSCLCTLLDKMLVMDPRRRIAIEYVCTDYFFKDSGKNVQPNESPDFTSDIK